MKNNNLLKQLEKSHTTCVDKIAELLTVLYILDPSESDVEMNPDPKLKQKVQRDIQNLSEEEVEDYKAEINNQLKIYSSLRKSIIQKQANIARSKNNRL